jgi:Type IV secretory pathway, TrbF components
MFKRPSVHYGRTPAPVTPYQKAAQVWDERIGSARVQAKNWRLMAFGSLILSAGLASGLVWQSTQGSVTPWVIEVDRLGQAEAVSPANPFYQPNRSADCLSFGTLHRRMCAGCRLMPSCCVRTGCAPTTLRPIAAPPPSMTTPASTIPLPNSASCRSQWKYRASSVPRRRAFASPGSSAATTMASLRPPSAGPPSYHRDRNPARCRSSAQESARGLCQCHQLVEGAGQ